MRHAAQARGGCSFRSRPPADRDLPIISRSAAAPQQKPEPRIRCARFAEEDLVSTFGEAILAEARRLPGAGAIDLTTTGRAIKATIVADGEHRRVVLNPIQKGPRVAFLGPASPRPFRKLGGLTNPPSARLPASIARQLWRR